MTRSAFYKIGYLVHVLVHPELVGLECGSEFFDAEDALHGDQEL